MIDFKVSCILSMLKSLFHTNSLKKIDAWLYVISQMKQKFEKI